MKKSKTFFDGNCCYRLDEDAENKKYYIVYYRLDDKYRKYNKVYEEEIPKDVYDAFTHSRLQNKRERNEFDRHIEHLEINENTLHNRTSDRQINIIDEIIRKSMFEDVTKAIAQLPEIQKRRIKKYYFESKTFEQIAQEENCTKRAVKFSVDIAIKEIYKKLTN